jgi:hypothetical protein
MYLVAVPAYGRDYQNKKDLLKDWNDGKDFLIDTFNHMYDGKYFNKAQSDEMRNDGVSHVTIRYKQNRMIVVIKL